MWSGVRTLRPTEGGGVGDEWLRIRLKDKVPPPALEVGGGTLE